jgi:hypothetical protein
VLTELQADQGLDDFRVIVHLMTMTAVTAGITRNLLSRVVQLPMNDMEQIGAITPRPGVVEEQQIATELTKRRRKVARDAHAAASGVHHGAGSFVIPESLQTGRTEASAGIRSRETEKRYAILSAECFGIACLVEAVVSDANCLCLELPRMRKSLNVCRLARITRGNVDTIIRICHVIVSDHASRECV